MTLKEFSAQYILPNDAWLTDEEPTWQKAFPTNLRYHEVQAVRNEVFHTIFGPKEKKIVVKEKIVHEEWVRIHAGQIIDREWRPLYVY